MIHLSYLSDLKEQIKEQLLIKTPLIWIYTKEESIADKTAVRIVYSMGLAEHFYYSTVSGGAKIDPITMRPVTVSGESNMDDMFNNSNNDKYKYPLNVGNTAQAVSILFNCDEPTCLVVRNDSDIFNNEQTQRNLVEECYRDNHEKSLYHPIFVISVLNTVPKSLEDFTKVIELPLMRECDSHNVIKNWVKKKNIQLGEQDLAQAAQSATGLTTTQLIRCLEESCFKEGKINPKYINDIRVEMVKQSGVLTYIEPKKTLENIGGHNKLKQWIIDSKRCMTPQAKKAGIDTPRGFLALGQAGTGKSAIAEAVAEYLKVPFIIFDLSKMMGGLVGQSERAVRHAFEILDSIGRCVVLIDEVDKQLGGVSGGTAANDGGTLMRVFGVILQHMQDNKNGQFYIMTANDVESLPAPLLRAGRLDTKWFFDFPSEHERKDIFKIYLKDIADSDIVAYAAKQAEHFTGAEIKTAVDNMKRQAFLNNSKINKNIVISALDAVSTIYDTNHEEVTNLTKYAEEHKIPKTSSRQLPENTGITNIDIQHKINKLDNVIADMAGEGV